MHLTITRFNLGPNLTGAEAVRLFEQSLPRYAAVPGLLSKYYYLGAEGQAGGVYLWARAQDAQAFFTPEFTESIRRRFGSTPTVESMDCPIWLDNQHASQRIEPPAP
jgi:hypothetical protein